MDKRAEAKTDTFALIRQNPAMLTKMLSPLEYEVLQVLRAAPHALNIKSIQRTIAEKRLMAKRTEWASNYKLAETNKVPQYFHFEDKPYLEFGSDSKLEKKGITVRRHEKVEVWKEAEAKQFLEKLAINVLFALAREFVEVPGDLTVERALDGLKAEQFVLERILPEEGRLFYSNPGLEG